MKKKLLVTFLIIFLIVQIIFPMIYQVKGESMIPTFNDGQWLIIDYYGFNDKYKKDDFIVFNEAGETMIKRVIGVGGDLIRITDNIIYINDVPIDEDYLLEPMQTKDMNFTVPEDAVFVLGDNRNQSVDSRSYGLINLSNIVGKVIYTFD